MGVPPSPFSFSMFVYFISTSAQLATKLETARWWCERGGEKGGGHMASFDQTLSSRVIEYSHREYSTAPTPWPSSSTTDDGGEVST